MDDDEPCSDPLADAILAHLIRKGILEEADAVEIADRLDAMGEESAAHMARCAIVRAREPSQADWEAERRRSKLRLITPDGGNEPT